MMKFQIEAYKEIRNWEFSFYAEMVNKKYTEVEHRFGKDLIETWKDQCQIILDQATLQYSFMLSTENASTKIKMSTMHGTSLSDIFSGAVNILDHMKQDGVEGDFIQLLENHLEDLEKRANDYLLKKPTQWSHYPAAKKLEKP